MCMRLICILLLFIYGSVQAQRTAQEQRDSLAAAWSFKDIDMGPNFIYIIDGFQVDQKVYASLKLKAKEMKKREVVDRKEGEKIFGKTGRDGVVIIETTLPLVVNNKVVKKKSNVKNRIPQPISSIARVRDQELIKAWGVKTKAGALVVTY